MARVSVAEVHHTYSADDRTSEIKVHRPDDNADGETGQPSGLRRWPSQESLERASSTKGSSYRQSDRPASDVGSINPTWRDQDDDHGVGFAAVQGHREEDTRDSDSEYDVTRGEDEDDRSAPYDDRDSLADYERPEGVAATTVMTTAAAVRDDDDDDVASQRSSVAASSQMYQSHGRTPSSPSPPSPMERQQSPLGGPAPAGVSSGLAGLGEPIFLSFTPVICLLLYSISQESANGQFSPHEPPHTKCHPCCISCTTFNIKCFNVIVLLRNN